MSLTCVRCGGTEFFRDAGFYFCNDCQTQTQDIREHLHDNQVNDEDHPPKRPPKKKTKRPGKSKEEERLTSWECYNYILLGLVNELIDLGANESLRTTVEVLWLHYLKTIEVIRDGNLPPKLPAVNIDRDAAIIYGRTKPVKRRRSYSRSVGSVTDASTLDEHSLKKERTKHKRALARSEYDDILSSAQQSDTSLANQSLASLKSKAGATDKNKVIQYNKYAIKYLTKRMKKSHLKKHCEDEDLTLKCHRGFSGRKNMGYYLGPSLMSRGKLYSLLYLGLLINKEKIQLGDMLRYIREGHLSFQHINNFFPEEVVEKKLNANSFTMGSKFIAHTVIRTYAANLVSLLRITNYVPVQNIVEMCKRYCKELNLPDCVNNFALNIISRTLPKFPLISTLPMPNYEGRTMAFIIFILKLLFGLDDATEYEMSSLSSIINERLESSAEKMFNIKRWLVYLQYRHFVLSKYNFDVSYTENLLYEGRDFVNHLESYYEKHQVVKEDNAEIEVFRRLLNKMDDVWEPVEESIIYNATLTPYKDYLTSLLDNDRRKQNYNETLLRLDCSNTSLEFLFYTELYLKNIFPNSDIVYKHGGKNNDIQFMFLFDSHKKYWDKYDGSKRLCNVTLLSHQSLSKFPNFFKDSRKDSDMKIKPNSEDLIKNFEHSTADRIKRNAKRRQRMFQNVDISLNMKEDINIPSRNRVIYEPSERFCANLQNITFYTEEKWERFYKTLSLSFRIILRECARITEQTTKDIYLEYLRVETYLTHVLDIGKDRPYKEKVVNSDLRNTIEQTIRLW